MNHINLLQPLQLHNTKGNSKSNQCFQTGFPKPSLSFIGQMKTYTLKNAG